MNEIQGGRGAASGAVGDIRHVHERIDEAVRIILEQFPPYVFEDEETHDSISAAMR